MIKTDSMRTKRRPSENRFDRSKQWVRRRIRQVNLFVKDMLLIVIMEPICCQLLNDALRDVGAYFLFYNNERPLQALGYLAPAEVFHGDQTVREEESKDRRCSDGSLLGSYAGMTGLSLNSALIPSK